MSKLKTPDDKILQVDKALTPQQIERLYGVRVRTLKTMRENPKANNGDVPNWFPICGRPLYPTAEFDIWFQKQKNKKDVAAVRAVRAVKA